MNDRIYSQFATHNAHTVAAILELATDFNLCVNDYEFQRLHGMGEALHDVVRQQHHTQCRIYAPVGSHRQLLAYLVRRLLENGANSSFVNQLSDPDIPAADIAQDPFATLDEHWSSEKPSPVISPALLYGKQRPNSMGFDINNIADMQQIVEARNKFSTTQWSASSLVATEEDAESRHDGRPFAIVNPSDNTDVVGHVLYADADTIESAIQAARPWSDSTGAERHQVLMQASYDLESAYGELFALLSREAGKTTLDAIAELREAVDFMRYYGLQASTQETLARGVFACISPWNFPLAIFLGQVTAALAAGNAVVCKPAESTAIVAWRAVQILHAAGVPRAALQLLPGLGADVGRAITTDARVQGVCFTGSTAVAQQINASMATTLVADAPLIAETGGLNAMIIDSTALPEQAIKDVVASAFQSAGQRCSALRILCLQDDIADEFKKMLFGAMDELHVGPVWQLQSDVGPIISRTAQEKILGYIDEAARQGRVIKQTQLRQSRVEQGTFVAPTVIHVEKLSDVTEEIFGPVLHVLEFSSADIGALLAEINNSGYGLTFGLHTRIESRVDHIVSTVKTGNLYVNRNQIGAVVGSQPFGGEGLSGTGPKAGGPLYLQRFRKPVRSFNGDSQQDGTNLADTEAVQEAINQLSFDDSPLSETQLPGLSTWPCAVPRPDTTTGTRASCATDENRLPGINNHPARHWRQK
jgi:RHH-type proline utilization regulon transcriptional repressor/proline dehydrogenase/delta 1-pyrroline-5-carboxylate dehydrogenase